MNYDHSYHAGNFADVFKHVVLMLLIQKLQQKPNPYCYIDTHSGYPYYDLLAEMPQKSLEAQTGIGLLWQANDISKPLQAYLQLITDFNRQFDGNQQFYPGSAAIAASLKRADDVMILNELHPKPYAELKNFFVKDNKIACHHQNGYQALKAFLPPKPNRGLVLIDPPFEAKDEFDQLIMHIKTALSRWPNGIFAIWYPVKSSAVVDNFIKRIKQNVTTECMDFRCCPWESDVSQRLSGSGILIINPPWQIEQSIVPVATELEQIFRNGFKEEI